MMGYDIYNDRGDYFRANISTWPRLLHVGEANGWHPMGTKYDDPEWDGGYESTEGQVICADDAADLADALQRGIETGDGIADALELGPSQLEQCIANFFSEIGATSFVLCGNSFRDKIAEAAEFFSGGNARIL